MNDLVIFSGNSNPTLAESICRYLDMPLGKAKVKRFSDGEIRIEIDENVRSRDVFVIQSTCAPVNDNLVELLLMIDAMKRSSARRITAVIPYYGYARQDQEGGAPGAHQRQACGGSDHGCRHQPHHYHGSACRADSGLFQYSGGQPLCRPGDFEVYQDKALTGDLVIVSPDAGGVERARAFAKRLDAGLAIIDKRRDAPNKAKAMSVIGDVAGKIAIILDDMVDTAGTLTEAASALIDQGAREVYACCTHPVLSGPAVERIRSSVIKNLIVTDTIPLSEHARGTEKITLLSIAELFGEAIIRSYRGDSVNSLFV